MFWRSGVGETFRGCSGRDVDVSCLHTPEPGAPEQCVFRTSKRYRGYRVFEPFGRFRIYYRVLGKELHAGSVFSKAIGWLRATTNKMPGERMLVFENRSL